MSISYFLPGNDALERNLKCWVAGINKRNLDMEVAEGQPGWYAYLNIAEWKDQCVLGE